MDPTNVIAVQDSFAMFKETVDIVISETEVVISVKNRPNFLVTGLFPVKSAEQCLEEDPGPRNLPNETAKTAVENVDESSSQ